MTTTPTGRCGFAWHITACIGLGAVFYLQLAVYTQQDCANDDLNDHDNLDTGMAWQTILHALRVFSTMVLALFVATPLLYFVVNSSTVVTTSSP